MLSGIVFQIFYGLIGSWTAYLISVLYMEYRTRKEKENVNFKNHVIQWLEVLEGLLGPYWKAVGLAFNCTFLLFGSVIQLIGCARRFTHIDEDCHPELEQLGCCLAELSLLDYYYVQFLPSMIAASVVLLGKFILNSKKHPWSKSLQNGTGYSPSDLRECILRLDHFQKDAKHRDEIKSAREKFAGVTSLPFEPSIPEDYFHTSED